METRAILQCATDRATRRGVLKGAAAFAAFPAAGARAEFGTPKRGGHFILALGHGSSADTLDPAGWDNQFTNCLSHTMHARLTEIAADGRAVGEAASDWRSDEAGQEWRFALRDGLRFHDGRPVTAEDAAASLQYHRQPDSRSAAKPLLDGISAIRVDGRDLVISLHHGNMDLPYLLADGHLVILPSGLEGRSERRFDIGCGPYRLERFEPGIAASFVRHDAHWRDDRAFFDSVEIRASMETAAREAALMAGQVHAIDRVGLTTASLLARTPGIRVDSVAGTQHYTFPMLCDRAPFDSLDVRLALKHALDRTELVEKILHGHGEVGNDVPITRGNRFYNDAMPQHEYDPDRARFHLKRAGYNRLDVQLSASDAAFPGAVAAADLYRERAKTVGIEIEVIREPADGYWTNVWRRKDWCACYWGGRVTEDSMFSSVYRSGVPWNDTHWTNDRFDALLLEARVERDPNRRRALYFEMQDILRREGGTVIPLYAHHVFARRDSIGAPERMGSDWTLDGSRCTERWWFA